MLTLVLLLLAIVLIIVTTSVWKWHPFLALLLACVCYGIGSGMPPLELVDTISTGFGDTVGKVGLLIIAGLIIGTFLEKTGGAMVLAESLLRLIGTKRIHTALGFIGYVVSIPVFADSGFIILASLNKALTRRAGLSLGGTAVALSMGLMASHTMVPPTPGPIAAAAILEADLGRVILIGLCTSVPALLVCIAFTKYMGSRIFIEARVSEAEDPAEVTHRPPVVKAFLPILLPILLIVLASVAAYPTRPFGEGTIYRVFTVLGNPVIALFLGVLASFLLPRKLDRSMLGSSGWVGEALRGAALIILITGAGGAFGEVLKTSPLGEVLEGWITTVSPGLWLPFVLAAVIKTAQGSSTVAILTTASIVFPLLDGMGFDSASSRALVVVAIGAGSAVVSHANDSFFWVVTQLSDMTVQQGYRLHALGSAILGLSAFLVLSLLSLIV
ncbi:GntP family permease [Neolewinella sp.]|uniref:GntP family permease n=1 Tax=Neolewinella sp. TaxID=2993543 RepID=UPI003B524BD0